MLKKEGPSFLKKLTRMDKFLFIFNLRQGTICIAVQNIALTSYILILYFVGLAHTREMLTALSSGLRDEEEKSRDAAEVDSMANEHSIVNNYDKFTNAQHVADATVHLVWAGTCLTMAYLLCCILLLHGAIKLKKKFLIPWMILASIAVVTLAASVMVFGVNPRIVQAVGGVYGYHFCGVAVILTFSYAIFTVANFSMQLGRTPEGERMLLLDHAANSNLLSATQFNKMAANPKTNFV